MSHPNFSSTSSSSSITIDSNEITLSTNLFPNSTIPTSPPSSITSPLSPLSPLPEYSSTTSLYSSTNLNPFFLSVYSNNEKNFNYLLKKYKQELNQFYSIYFDDKIEKNNKNMIISSYITTSLTSPSTIYSSATSKFPSTSNLQNLNNNGLNIPSISSIQPLSPFNSNTSPPKLLTYSSFFTFYDDVKSLERNILHYCMLNNNKNMLKKIINYYINEDKLLQKEEIKLFLINNINNINNELEETQSNINEIDYNTKNFLYNYYDKRKLFWKKYDSLGYTPIHLLFLYENEIFDNDKKLLNYKKNINKKKLFLLDYLLNYLTSFSLSSSSSSSLSSSDLSSSTYSLSSSSSSNNINKILLNFFILSKNQQENLTFLQLFLKNNNIKQNKKLIILKYLFNNILLKKFLISNNNTNNSNKNDNDNENNNKFYTIFYLEKKYLLKKLIKFLKKYNINNNNIRKKYIKEFFLLYKKKFYEKFIDISTSSSSSSTFQSYQDHDFEIEYEDTEEEINEDKNVNEKISKKLSKKLSKSSILSNRRSFQFNIEIDSSNEESSDDSNDTLSFSDTDTEYFYSSSEENEKDIEYREESASFERELEREREIEREKELESAQEVLMFSSSRAFFPSHIPSPSSPISSFPSSSFPASVSTSSISNLLGESSSLFTQDISSLSPRIDLPSTFDTLDDLPSDTLPSLPTLKVRPYFLSLSQFLTFRDPLTKKNCLDIALENEEEKIVSFLLNVKKKKGNNLFKNGERTSNLCYKKFLEDIFYNLNHFLLLEIYQERAKKDEDILENEKEKEKNSNYFLKKLLKNLLTSNEPSLTSSSSISSLSSSSSFLYSLIEKFFSENFTIFNDVRDAANIFNQKNGGNENEKETKLLKILIEYNKNNKNKRFFLFFLFKKLIFVLFFLLSKTKKNSTSSLLSSLTSPSTPSPTSSPIISSLLTSPISSLNYSSTSLTNAYPLLSFYFLHVFKDFFNFFSYYDDKSSYFLKLLDHFSSDNKSNLPPLPSNCPSSYANFFSNPLVSFLFSFSPSLFSEPLSDAVSPNHTSYLYFIIDLKESLNSFKIDMFKLFIENPSSFTTSPNIIPVSPLPGTIFSSPSSSPSPSSLPNQFSDSSFSSLITLLFPSSPSSNSSLTLSPSKSPSVSSGLSSSHTPLYISNSSSKFYIKYFYSDNLSQTIVDLLSSTTFPSLSSLSHSPFVYESSYFDLLFSYLYFSASAGSLTSSLLILKELHPFYFRDSKELIENLFIEKRENKILDDKKKIMEEKRKLRKLRKRIKEDEEREEINSLNQFFLQISREYSENMSLKEEKEIEEIEKEEEEEYEQRKKRKEEKKNEKKKRDEKRKVITINPLFFLYFSGIYGFFQLFSSSLQQYLFDQIRDKISSSYLSTTLSSSSFFTCLYSLNPLNDTLLFSSTLKNNHVKLITYFLKYNENFFYYIFYNLFYIFYVDSNSISFSDFVSKSSLPFISNSSHSNSCSSLSKLQFRKEFSSRNILHFYLNQFIHSSTNGEEEQRQVAFSNFFDILNKLPQILSKVRDETKINLNEFEKENSENIVKNNYNSIKIKSFQDQELDELYFFDFSLNNLITRYCYEKRAELDKEEIDLEELDSEDYIDIFSSSEEQENNSFLDRLEKRRELQSKRKFYDYYTEDINFEENERASTFFIESDEEYEAFYSYFSSQNDGESSSSASSIYLELLNSILSTHDVERLLACFILVTVDDSFYQLFFNCSYRSFIEKYQLTPFILQYEFSLLQEKFSTASQPVSSDSDSSNESTTSISTSNSISSLISHSSSTSIEFKNFFLERRELALILWDWLFENYPLFSLINKNILMIFSYFYRNTFDPSHYASSTYDLQTLQYSHSLNIKKDSNYFIISSLSPHPQNPSAVSSPISNPVPSKAPPLHVADNYLSSYKFITEQKNSVLNLFKTKKNIKIICDKKVLNYLYNDFFSLSQSSSENLLLPNFFSSLSLLNFIEFFLLQFDNFDGSFSLSSLLSTPYHSLEMSSLIFFGRDQFLLNSLLEENDEYDEKNISLSSSFSEFFDSDSDSELESELFCPLIFLPSQKSSNSSSSSIKKKKEKILKYLRIQIILKNLNYNLSSSSSPHQQRKKSKLNLESIKRYYSRYLLFTYIKKKDSNISYRKTSKSKDDNSNKEKKKEKINLKYFDESLKLLCYFNSIASITNPVPPPPPRSPLSPCSTNSHRSPLPFVPLPASQHSLSFSCFSLIDDYLLEYFERKNSTYFSQKDKKIYKKFFNASSFQEKKLKKLINLSNNFKSSLIFLGSSPSILLEEFFLSFLDKLNKKYKLPKIKKECNKVNYYENDDDGNDDENDDNSLFSTSSISSTSLKNKKKRRDNSSESTTYSDISDSVYSSDEDDESEIEHEKSFSRARERERESPLLFFFLSKKDHLKFNKLLNNKNLFLSSFKKKNNNFSNDYLEEKYVENLSILLRFIRIIEIGDSYENLLLISKDLSVKLGEYDKYFESEEDEDICNEEEKKKERKIFATSYISPLSSSIPPPPPSSPQISSPQISSIQSSPSFQKKSLGSSLVPHNSPTFSTPSAPRSSNKKNISTPIQISPILLKEHLEREGEKERNSAPLRNRTRTNSDLKEKEGARIPIHPSLLFQTPVKNSSTNTPPVSNENKSLLQPSNIPFRNPVSYVSPDKDISPSKGNKESIIKGLTYASITVGAIVISNILDKE